MLYSYDNIETKDLGGGVTRKVLAHEGRLMNVEVSFKKGAVGAVHTHPHEQIGYVLYGSFEYEENGVKTVIKKGDSYYVGANVPHGVVALEDSALLDIFTPQREDFIA